VPEEKDAARSPRSDRQDNANRPKQMYFEGGTGWSGGERAIQGHEVFIAGTRMRAAPSGRTMMLCQIGRGLGFRADRSAALGAKSPRETPLDEQDIDSEENGRAERRRVKINQQWRLAS